jgi:hypothetical protein
LVLLPKTVPLAPPMPCPPKSSFDGRVTLASTKARIAPCQTSP